MKWHVGDKRTIYDSEWVALDIVDVDPGGGPFPHHVVRMPKPAVASVVIDPERGVLLLWRHRFITDTWGWEVPAGTAGPGEDLGAAAAREVLEETGWRPGSMRPLVDFYAASGIADLHFHVFLGTDVEHVGAPADAHEADKVEWVSVDGVRRIIGGGDMPDGASMLALLYAMERGELR